MLRPLAVGNVVNERQQDALFAQMKDFRRIERLEDFARSGAKADRHFPHEPLLAESLDHLFARSRIGIEVKFYGGVADDLFAGIFELVQQPRVGVEKPAGGDVGDAHQGRIGVERFGETCLAFPQRRFRSFAFGDIQVRPDHAHRPAGGVPLHDPADGAHPNPVAGAGPQAKFGVVIGQFAGNALLVKLQDPRAVVRVQPVRPPGRRQLQLGRFVAEHSGVFVAEDRLAGGDVQVVQPLAGNRQRQRQAFLALAQGGLRLPLGGEWVSQHGVVFAAVEFKVMGHDFDGELRTLSSAIGGLEAEGFRLAQFAPVLGPAVAGKIEIKIPDCQGQQFLPAVAERLTG